tara:strand:- start:155 stop:925 length:771 start_codon:yes stop_codon:yes gene_type:complete
MFQDILYNLIWTLRKIPRKTYNKNAFKNTQGLRNPYRYYLFEELKNIFQNNYFANKRILEIGPKDGEDSLRLASLNPSELIMIDLPENKDPNHHNFKFHEEYFMQNYKKISGKKNILYENFNYLKNDELDNLGKFDLIWFTGVLYHTQEQLRMLRKIFNLLNPNGVLVLETSTTRNNSLKKQSVIEITIEGQYHFPSKKAVTTMLGMIGFSDLIISKCFDKENYNKNNIRFALFAQKKEKVSQNLYREKYLYGDAT